MLFKVKINIDNWLRITKGNYFSLPLSEAILVLGVTFLRKFIFHVCGLLEMTCNHHSLFSKTNGHGVLQNCALDIRVVASHFICELPKALKGLLRALFLNLPRSALQTNILNIKLNLNLTFEDPLLLKICIWGNIE